MSVTPLDGDTYPEPVAEQGSGFSSVWRVLLLAVVFIAVAVVFSLYGETIPAMSFCCFSGFSA